MLKEIHIPPAKARLRSVFSHSRKVSETPQPGIQHQSTSSTTSPVASPSTANTVDGVSSQYLPHRSTTLPPHILSRNSSNNDNSSESSTKRIVKVDSIFSKSDSKTSPFSVINSHSPINSVPPKENIVIDKYTLITAWKQIQEEKNLFDNASIMRIISVEPILIGENHFEIYVANPNAESFFQTNRDVILKALSAHLNNQMLEMSIKIVQNSNSQKILSPLEQIKEMISQNPSLGKLKDNLDLSI